jgi:AcrR family transcriptional regulator
MINHEAPDHRARFIADGMKQFEDRSLAHALFYLAIVRFNVSKWKLTNACCISWAFEFSASFQSQRVPMARPRQISDEQILSTMSSCVLSHGPQVSLDQVAKELGVTGPALLKRFGTREELMLKALLPPEVPAFLDEISKTGPTAGDPLEPQFEALLIRFWEFIAEVMPRIIALRESGIAPEKLWPSKTAPLRANVALVAWLDAGVKHGLIEPMNTESVGLAMIGALQARVMAAHLTNQSFSLKSQRAYLKDLARLFTRAVTPDRKAARPTPKTPRSAESR